MNKESFQSSKFLKMDSHKNWAVYYHPKYKRPYTTYCYSICRLFVNQTEKIPSRWTNPFLDTNDPKLCWYQTIDVNTNKAYFVNAYTKETRWKLINEPYIELLKDSLGRVCAGSDATNNSAADSPLFLGGNKLARATSTRIRMSMRLSNVKLPRQKSQQERRSSNSNKILQRSASTIPFQRKVSNSSFSLTANTKTGQTFTDSLAIAKCRDDRLKEIRERFAKAQLPFTQADIKTKDGISSGNNGLDGNNNNKERRSEDEDEISDDQIGFYVSCKGLFNLKTNYYYVICPNNKPPIIKVEKNGRECKTYTISEIESLTELKNKPRDLKITFCPKDGVKTYEAVSNWFDKPKILTFESEEKKISFYRLVNEYQRKYWENRFYEIAESKAQDDRANDCIRWQIVLLFPDGFQPCDLLLNLRDPSQKYITFINSNDEYLSKTMDWEGIPITAIEQIKEKAKSLYQTPQDDCLSKYHFEVENLDFKQGVTVKSNPSALHMTYKNGEKKVKLVTVFRTKDERDNFIVTIQQ